MRIGIKAVSIFVLSAALLISPRVFGEGNVAGRSAFSMAALQDGDIALRMYGENLTWGELKRLMAREGVSLQKDQDRIGS